MNWTAVLGPPLSNYANYSEHLSVPDNPGPSASMINAWQSLDLRGSPHAYADLHLNINGTVIVGIAGAAVWTRRSFSPAMYSV